jgi:hypothetical protein
MVTFSEELIKMWTESFVLQQLYVSEKNHKNIRIRTVDLRM